MNALAISVVSALLVSAIPAQEASRTEQTVDRMLKRLGDPRAELADATMLGMIRGGTASAPLLRAMLAKTSSPGVRAPPPASASYSPRRLPRWMFSTSKVASEAAKMRSMKASPRADSVSLVVMVAPFGGGHRSATPR